MKQQLLDLRAKSNRIKTLLQTEEATKLSLIVPFLNILGYDVTDPSEVVPELDCDLAKIKGEKIDFAIKHKDEVVILIECKHHLQNLDNHCGQLAKYFVASEAKLAILTNGIEYRFYTDITKANIMDTTPFFIFNIENFEDEDAEYLSNFHKEHYNIDAIYSSAKSKHDFDEVYNLLNSELNNPSVDFLKYIYRRIYKNERITDVKIKRFRELFNLALSNITNSSPKVTESVSAQPTNTDGVYTYKEETDIFNAIKSICSDLVISESDFIFRDMKSYSTVSFHKTYLWFIRIYYYGDWNKAYISLLNTNEMKGEAKRIKISSVKDIYENAAIIKETAQQLLQWIKNN